MAGSGQFLRSKDNNRKCIDCGKTIEIGERYWYLAQGQKKYIYCEPCKAKPEHTRRTYDHEGIVLSLFEKPLFKHEFEDKYDIHSSGQANELIHRLMRKGYIVNKFRWNYRSRYNSKIGERESYRQGFQPNQFIIYYIEGTENKVVMRLLDVFEYDHVDWHGILPTLFGQKIPHNMIGNKESLLQWANSNVYNYVVNNRQEEVV